MRQGSVCPRPVAVALSITLLFAASLAGAVTGGNDFYTLRVEGDPNGFGVGLYTVGTGPLHPVTGALGSKDILFGGTLRPGQSYTTIRSYTSGVDYLQNRGVLLQAGAPPTEILEGFVAPGDEAIPIGDPNNPSGYETVYRIGAVAAAADSLHVVQRVEATGATFNDSAVKIETTITNVGSAAVELGVRYLWDFRIGFDDGPTYQALAPDGPVEGFEVSSLSPVFDTYEIVDNNASSCFSGANPTVPFFAVQGSVTGPAVLSPAPPTRLDFAAWPAVSGLSGLVSAAVPQPSAFDYTGTGVDTTTCDVSLDDSATIYWWGDDASTALVVPAGGSVTIAAYIFGYLPGTPPTFEPPPGVEGPFDDPSCTDGADNDGDGLIDQDDPDCAPPLDPEGPFDDPSCSDGVDNDGDGLIDGDDPDCAPPNDPPDCSAAGPTIEELWPPNHKFKEVGIHGVVDPDGDPVTVTISGVFSDEPINGKGDGNTCPDAGGVGGERLMLRSERSGQRDGRIYHVFFDAEDGNGGICSGAVSVCVPHDRGKGRKKVQCVDQGPVFDATGPCSAGAAECVSRKSKFFGAKPEGFDLLTGNEAGSLKLHPQDPLRGLYPDGNLLPVQLGGGGFLFQDVESIAGTSVKGSNDGGFLPGRARPKGMQAIRNLLPAETLTLGLNTGLSLLQAPTGESLDLDGDSVPEPLAFRAGFPGLVVDRPGKLGDLMTVEEVLMAADEALANGAGNAKGNEPLSRYVQVAGPAVQAKGTKGGGGKGKNGKVPTVGDLVHLVTEINAACNVPKAKPSGTLRVP